jgi:hypothetical protein
MKTAHPYISHYPRRNRRRSWGHMPRLRPSLGLAILLGWLATYALAWAATWLTCELHTLIH